MHYPIAIQPMQVSALTMAGHLSCNYNPIWLNLIFITTQTITCALISFIANSRDNKLNTISLFLNYFFCAPKVRKKNEVKWKSSFAREKKNIKKTHKSCLFAYSVLSQQDYLHNYERFFLSLFFIFPALKALQWNFLSTHIHLLLLPRRNYVRESHTDTFSFAWIRAGGENVERSMLQQARGEVELRLLHTRSVFVLFHFFPI